MKILSASFANEDNTAVVLMTEERGSVLISLKDRPDLWDEYIKSNIVASPFVPDNFDAMMDSDIEKAFNDGGFVPAFCRVMFSELNILRQAAGLSPRTPTQALNAIKARKRT